MIKQNQLLIGLILMVLVLAGCLETKNDSNRYTIDWNAADQNKDLNQPIDVNQKIEPNQFFCEKNDDCVKTDALNCCGCESGSPEVAVSKQWLAAVTLPVCSTDTVCTRSYHCTERIAQCVRNRCMLVYPTIELDQNSYHFFDLNQEFEFYSDTIYQSKDKTILLSDVAVYSFSCPFNQPCAVQEDKVGFTLQFMKGDQTIATQQVVLTENQPTQSFLVPNEAILDIKLMSPISDKTSLIISLRRLEG